MTRIRAFAPWVVGYLILGLLWWAFRNPWVVLALVGLTCNALAVGLNGGRMPVRTDAPMYQIAVDGRHTVMHPWTRVPWLCDIIETVWAYWSVGDILTIVGAAGSIVSSMLQAVLA